MTGNGDGRFTNASEVGTFVFCARALALQRADAPSAREPERVDGNRHHEAHGRRVDASSRLQGAAHLLLAAAMAMLAIGLWLTLR